MFCRQAEERAAKDAALRESSDGLCNNPEYQAAQALCDDIEHKSGLIRDNKYRFTVYPASLVGTELVDWMISSAHATSREQAVKNVQDLFTFGLMEHVCGDHDFKDEALFFHLRAHHQHIKEPSIALKIFLSLATSPIVIALVFGITVSLVPPFQDYFAPGTPPKLSDTAFFSRLLHGIGSPFGFCAIFNIGAALAMDRGETAELKTSKQIHGIVILVSLVTLKNLVAPIIDRYLLEAMVRDPPDHLTDYAFLYGCLPAAAAPSIFASTYGVPKDNTMVFTATTVRI